MGQKLPSTEFRFFVQTERLPRGPSEIQFSLLAGYKPDQVFLRAGRRRSA